MVFGHAENKGEKWNGKPKESGKKNEKRNISNGKKSRVGKDFQVLPICYVHMLGGWR